LRRRRRRRRRRKVRVHGASSGRFPEEERGASMTRIVVAADIRGSDEHRIPLDGEGCPEHMSDKHSASQLFERLGRAVSDAELAPAGAAR
jgi:hypothetical protein